MHEEMNKMGQNLPPGAFLLMFVSCVLVECVCVCVCVCVSMCMQNGIQN